MSNKDYSKLRPFDLEAARDRGALLTGSNPNFEGKPVWKYAAGPDALGKIIATDLTEGIFTNPANTDGLRMAPLAWVRKSADDDTLWPVYPGDTLYGAQSGIAYKASASGFHPESGYGIPLTAATERVLTFTPPKVKRGGLYAVFEGAPGYFEIRGPFKDNIEAENARSMGVLLVTTFVREWSEEAAEQQDDGWRDWPGGDRPVLKDTLVDITLRNGRQDTNRAVAFWWDHRGKDADIVAYRICSNQESAK